MNLFTCHIVFVIQDQLIVDTVDVCCFFFCCLITNQQRNRWVSKRAVGEAVQAALQGGPTLIYTYTYSISRSNRRRSSSSNPSHVTSPASNYSRKFVDHDANKSRCFLRSEARQTCIPGVFSLLQILNSS